MVMLALAFAGLMAWLIFATHQTIGRIERASSLVEKYTRLEQAVLDHAAAAQVGPPPEEPRLLYRRWGSANTVDPAEFSSDEIMLEEVLRIEAGLQEHFRRLQQEYEEWRDRPSPALKAQYARDVLAVLQNLNVSGSKLRSLAGVRQEVTGAYGNYLRILVLAACLLTGIVVLLAASYRRSLARLQLQANALADANAALAAEAAARRQAEDSVHNREESYRRFFEEGLSGNFISTSDGILLACNRVFAKLFGYNAPDEMLSINMFSLYPDGAARQKFLTQLKTEKKLVNHESELRRKDGRVIHIVENAIGEFGPDGHLAQIRGYLIDNTRRKQLEDQLYRAAKLDAVGRLAGGIAHDFNNLLTAIIGYSNMLLLEVQSGQTSLKEGLTEIVRAGERSAGLIRRLLAFSRNQMLNPRLLDLNGVVKDLEKILRLLIGDQVEVEMKFTYNLGTVRADASQLETVILNLAVNARDAMPDGGKLTITTANVRIRSGDSAMPIGVPPGEYSVLAVSDNGVGMDSHVKAHLFEPFFTTKDQGHGTGLGLATAYGVVKQSGGHILVDSEPGRGTTFRIFLPQVAEDAKPKTDPPPRRPLPAMGNETILLVDDEEVVRVFAERALKSHGYQVLSAGSAADALTISETHNGPIHMLATDIIMPQINGRELAQHVLRDRPDIKVLYMTGHAASSGSRIIPSPMPGQSLLRKPFTAEKLIRRVHEMLAGSTITGESA